MSGCELLVLRVGAGAGGFGVWTLVYFTPLVGDVLDCGVRFPI